MDWNPYNIKRIYVNKNVKVYDMWLKKYPHCHIMYKKN